MKPSAASQGALGYCHVLIKEEYHVTLDGVKVTSVRQMTVFVRNMTFNPPAEGNTGWIKPGMTKITIAKKAAIDVKQ